VRYDGSGKPEESGFPPEFSGFRQNDEKISERPGESVEPEKESCQTSGDKIQYWMRMAE
jgi:hypothetical protein